MTSTRHVGPPLPDSKARQRSSSGGRARQLPRDLLEQASTRIGIMSLVGAALWVLATSLGHVGSGVPFPQTLDLVAGVSALASVGLFVYSRRIPGNAQFILDLGLGYIVLTAFALGFSAHLSPLGTPEVLASWKPESEMSWIGVVVLIYAAIVPTPPVKTLVAGFVAVSMNPIAMLIGLARGTSQFGPPIAALMMHYPDYLLLGVAVVISRVVTQLSGQVTKARELGSYELGALLGRGGMGEVYKATHRMLARPAAIKLIRPEMLGRGDEELRKLIVQRFYREAGVAASLRSPHTVEVYDFGVTEDETLYFVMELLEGMDLESLVQRHGPLDARRVIHILCQACDSLEEAHARGLVHRDIKPANIHIGTLGLRSDFVKVLDFGLVTAPARSGQQLSLATGTGIAVGTPTYMAPEIAFGESVDGRADLYSLGCVAYFLLTGTAVFEAENVMQMIAKHLQAEPIPPSRRSNRTVPPALERIVLSCLAKDRDARPQSATALARTLEAAPLARWTEEEARTWWAVNAAGPRNPIDAPGALAGSTVLASGVISGAGVAAIH